MIRTASGAQDVRRASFRKGKFNAADQLQVLAPLRSTNILKEETKQCSKAHGLKCY
jgi:hypothetical protein